MGAVWELSGSSQGARRSCGYNLLLRLLLCIAFCPILCVLLFTCDVSWVHLIAMFLALTLKLLMLGAAKLGTILRRADIGWCTCYAPAFT